MGMAALIAEICVSPPTTEIALDEGLTRTVQAQVPYRIIKRRPARQSEWALPHASIAYSLFKGGIQARFDSLSAPDVQNPMQ
jgi:hypothetical protein